LIEKRILQHHLRHSSSSRSESHRGYFEKKTPLINKTHYQEKSAPLFTAEAQAISYAFFFNFIGFSQQMRSHVSTHPQAVSTDTTIPHTLHVYLLPFGTTGFLAAGFAAALAAGLAAGFAAGFALGAGFLAAGFAAALAAGLAAGFAAGLLFVAIVLPPLSYFCCANSFILSILNI
jgi:hypothetical protein